MSTAATQSLTSAIPELDSACPETALGQALLQWQQHGDTSALPVVLRALVRCGLAGLALRLLDAATKLNPSDQAMLEARRKIALLPTGEVPPATLERVWQRIRKQVLLLNPELIAFAANLDAPPQTHGYRTFRSMRGNVHVAQDHPIRPLKLLHPMVDHLAVAAKIDVPLNANTTSFLLVGAPNPAIWRRLIQLQSDFGHVPVIDLIEPDPVVLGLWLRLIGEDAIQGERTRLFTGPDAIDLYRTFIGDHSWREPPSHQLWTSRESMRLSGSAHDIAAPMIEARAARRRSALSKLQAIYAGRDAAWWRQRFTQAARKEPPLRVLGFTSRFTTVMQHAMRDLGAAFDRAGCRFELVMQPNAHATSVDVQAAMLSSTQPTDLVFVINHLRSEFSECLPPGVPFVCWMQDHMDHLCSAEAGRSVTDLDLIIAHSPLVLHSVYGYPKSRLAYSSNLTDSQTYSNAKLDDALLAPFRCDLSYVGHGSETPDELASSIAGPDGMAFTRIFNRFIELAEPELAKRGCLVGNDVVRLMLAAEQDCGRLSISAQARRAHVLPHVLRIYDRMLRHQTLEWASRWARSRARVFSIYGKGWARHPTLGMHARGEVASGPSLRALYQASRLGLQVNGNGSLHQRLLDGLAAGCCMICRYNPSDWVNVPFKAIRRTITERRITSLQKLLMTARTDHELARAIEEAEQLGGTFIRPLSDPVRAAHVAMLRAGNPVPELFTDDGLLQGLADGRFVGETCAGDLPGFRNACFSTEAEMHEILNSLIDDEDAQTRLAPPMRNHVIHHFTYDGLVQRVLDAFSGGGGGRTTS